MTLDGNTTDGQGSMLLFKAENGDQGVAGIAGGLFVPLNRFISPVYLAVAFGTQVVIWVAIGGRGTLIGPLIAAILLGQIQNSAERVTQDWQLVVGILLLIVVLFIPDGLVGSISKLFKKKAVSS